jgi:hypothetical protein
MAGIHRRKRKPTTTDDYAAMLTRMVRAYGRRIGQDHKAGLGHLRDLEAELTDAVNLGIYTANRVSGVSINQLAAELGVSKQAVHKRVGLGELVAKQQDRRPRPAVTTAPVARPRELPPGPTAQ